MIMVILTKFIIKTENYCNTITFFMTPSCEKALFFLAGKGLNNEVDSLNLNVIIFVEFVMIKEYSKHLKHNNAKHRYYESIVADGLKLNSFFVNIFISFYVMLINIIFYSFLVCHSIYLSVVFPEYLCSLVSMYYVIIFYLYEMCFQTLDKAHWFHHTVVIIHHCAMLYYKDDCQIVLMRLIIIQYFMMFSNIFSYIRQINTKFTYAYYYIYLFCKITGNCIYWYFVDVNDLNVFNQIHLHFSYIFTLFQGYFCYLIIKKLFNSKVI